MEYENHYASKGIAGTALGIGIGALGLEVLRGGVGNIFGTNNGNCGCNEDHHINRYEFGLQQEIAAKDSKIGLLESNIYTDAKIADVYERLNTKIGGLEAQICNQGTINAQVTANLACMQNTLATLTGLTKTVIPITSVCPEPAVATTTTGA